MKPLHASIDLTNGERAYMLSKGVSEVDFNNMDVREQYEWKEEFRNAHYYKSDIDIALKNRETRKILI